MSRQLQARGRVHGGAHAQRPVVGGGEVDVLGLLGGFERRRDAAAGDLQADDVDASGANVSSQAIGTGDS
jgi:hypothetical protein